MFIITSLLIISFLLGIIFLIENNKLTKSVNKLTEKNNKLYMELVEMTRRNRNATSNESYHRKESQRKSTLIDKLENNE